MAKKKTHQNESDAISGTTVNAIPKTAKSVKIAPAKGRPMLSWVGKKPIESVRTYPAQLVETFRDNDSDAEPNLLFHGDNKEVLAYLLTNGYRGQIDLIYIDPPFDSKADYVRTVELRGHKETVEAEGQTVIEQTQYADIWANDTYLQFMYERLILLRELLSDTGSIFLHADWHKIHLLRCLMDEVFGQDRIVNEIVWCYHGPGSPGMRQFNRKHDDILWYSKSGQWTFNADDVRIPHDDKTTGNFKGGLVGSGFTGDNYEIPDGKIPESHWVMAVASRYPIDGIKRTGYPTEKPVELLERIIKATSKPNDIVLDCFIGSGTAAAVAQNLGRRWIGCDINKGAIQTTSKRLQKIIRKQSTAGRQGRLVENQGIATVPVFNFQHYRVNDYDLQIQHNEALELALQHLNVERNRTDGFFDGLLGKKLVRVVPLNHPCTLMDLQLVENELKNRPDEDRDIIVVALGKDANVDGFIADYNKRRKVNKIVIIELRSDPKYGGFFEHQPAWVTFDVKAKTATVKIEITDFCSPTILERLNLDQTVFREKVTDFRSMIDVVLVDTNYNGKVFNIAFSDVPEKKTDFVKAKYDLLVPANSKRIAVKVIDMLGEEVLEVREIK